MKKTWPFIIIALVVIIGAILLFKQKPAEGLTLFYGQECPHCARVEEFLIANKIDEKVKINRVEVYHNQQNANDMAKIAQKCGIQTTQMGVPLLWDGSKCYEGEDEVKNYFQQFINNK